MGFLYWQRRAIAAALLVACTACTTVTVTPQASNPPPPPPQAYKNVVLGTVDAKDPGYAYVISFFREGFVRRLRELKGFETVTDSAAATTTTPAPDTLVVSATLTNVDKGDAALRLFIGMGAGRERVAATVTAKNGAGATLGSFDAQKAYSGGAGIGGAGFIDIEDLTKQLGEQAAQSFLDWTQGKLTASSQ